MFYTRNNVENLLLNFSLDLYICHKLLYHLNRNFGENTQNLRSIIVLPCAMFYFSLWGTIAENKELHTLQNLMKGLHQVAPIGLRLKTPIWMFHLPIFLQRIFKHCCKKETKKYFNQKSYNHLCHRWPVKELFWLSVGLLKKLK